MVTVGRLLPLLKRPWMIGLPFVSRMSASPPKSRIVDAASSAQRRMSGRRSASAETVGMSTNWRRAVSKRSRSLFANATSGFLSRLMAAHSIASRKGRRQDEQRERRLRKPRQDPPHLHRQRALVLQIQVDEKREKQRDRNEQRDRVFQPPGHLQRDVDDDRQRNQPRQSPASRGQIFRRFAEDRRQVAPVKCVRERDAVVADVHPEAFLEGGPDRRARGR